MDLLERGAVVDFGAKIVTLDTVAYLVVMDETNTYCVEDPTKPGRSQAWYKSRGYVQFRVSPPSSKRIWKASADLVAGSSSTVS